jgi:hypothetical protein
MSITVRRQSNRNRPGRITVGLTSIWVPCPPDQWKGFLDAIRQNRPELFALSRRRYFDERQHQDELMMMRLLRPVDPQGGPQTPAPTLDPHDANLDVSSDGQAPWPFNDDDWAFNDWDSDDLN